MKKSIKRSMTKVLLLSFLATGVVSTIAIPVSANSYESTITLPRSGWWSTVNRKANSSSARTYVNQNEVSIFARINNNAGTVATPVKEHKGLNSGVAVSSNNHAHGVSGATIHAQFRTGTAEPRTQRIRLGWTP